VDKIKGLQLLGLILILALALAGFWDGWKLFEFSTDDAYIAFRYVANSVRGWGFVYNPPPFLPVEGYTSFFWVFLLRVAWGVFGVEAPQAAQVLNPLFGLGWLMMAVAFVMRMRLWKRQGAWWLLTLALVLGGVLANRTFLAWLSSGLETSLFCFLFTWWVYEATARAQDRGRGWLTRLCLSAALLALSRPDGLLAVAGTCLILAYQAWRGRGSLASQLLSTYPLLLVPVHFIWRRLTYGDWLPNTYYAKHLGAWPESGLRYFASFVVEYGVYVWFLLVMAWGISRVRSVDAWPRWRHGEHGIGGAVAVAVLVIHAGYYTLSVGGDHFEYRIYAHLVPLLFVSTAGMAARLGGPIVTAAALAGFLLLSLPIPWTHWFLTRDLKTRDQTLIMVTPVAPSFPAPLRPVVERWDAWQRWLITHSVCTRHQEHKVFFNFQMADNVPEPARMSPTWNHQFIASHATIGVPGWKNLNTAIIDELGLTDRVIARQPITISPDSRNMAHDRKPPPGYLRCFRIAPASATQKAPRPAEVPLTDEEIRRCESKRWY